MPEENTTAIVQRYLAELTGEGIYPPEWVTEIGKVTSATCSDTPICRAAVSIAGRDASDDRVEMATACGAIMPRTNALAGTRLGLVVEQVAVVAQDDDHPPC